MTTWPPRYNDAVKAMAEIVKQREKYNLEDKVHCILVLSEDEVKNTPTSSKSLIMFMKDMDVEIVIDKGNIRSHKKLIPTLERYPDNPILVIDDDLQQQDLWLRTFVKDHEAYPEDIIYGMSRSKICVNKDGIIHEERLKMLYSQPGLKSINLKPANGASGTLYPAHTFKDKRFFDRELFMKVSPTSDETWQFAFAMFERPSFRCLSGHNIPYSIGAKEDCALYNTNVHIYDKIHNDIAAVIPEYLEALRKNCEN